MQGLILAGPSPIFFRGQKLKILQWHQWALLALFYDSQKPTNGDWGNYWDMLHEWFSPGALPQGGLGWTCAPHFCQRSFLRLMQIW